jgi:hypothetical protein
MGVPGSGTLSMLKMAREAKHGDYNGSQSMGTISMYDMMNGGNTGGSTVSYPTLNSATNPAGNSITVYYRSDVYSSQSSFVNTIGAVAYSSSTGSTHHPAGNGYNFEYIICTNEVNLNSSGQIITTTPIC